MKKGILSICLLAMAPLTVGILAISLNSSAPTDLEISTAKNLRFTTLYLIDKAAKEVENPYLFAEKVVAIAADLEVPPEWLMGVIDSESSFKSSIYNRRGSGAKGLIQLMPSAMKEIGIKEVPSNALEQLDNVHTYLKLRKKQCGTFRSFTDLKLAILYPAAVGKGKYYILASNPSKTYNLNRNLDSDVDGLITVDDIERKMKRKYAEAYAYKYQPVETPTENTNSPRSGRALVQP
ncbi:MAG: transglycosylase SLT domain-containing protein [Chitinophagales bacterium]